MFLVICFNVFSHWSRWGLLACPAPSQHLLTANWTLGKFVNQNQFESKMPNLLSEKNLLENMAQWHRQKTQTVKNCHGRRFKMCNMVGKHLHYEFNSNPYQLSMLIMMIIMIMTKIMIMVMMMMTHITHFSPHFTKQSINNGQWRHPPYGMTYFVAAAGADTNDLVAAVS